MLGPMSGAFDKLMHHILSSRKKIGLDFEYRSLIQSVENLKKKSVSDSLTRMGISVTGVLAAEVGPAWDMVNDATVSILKTTQSLIQSTYGPAVGIITTEGSDIKDRRVLANLVRLLREIQPSYVIYRSSSILSDNRACVIRSPSPWAGSAPSFESALELLRLTPPDLTEDGF
ncbi:uncharacterized protein LOC135392896 [Ornithodoros turicata]|uniref:uncharacterized protein LOC135392896 n=1 Tax=Ornithodoros turicata TaxID=34597 RepID=UPI003139E658